MRLVGESVGKSRAFQGAAAVMIACLLSAATALAQDIAPLSTNPERQGVVQQAEQTPPGEDQAVYSDPLAPFNEAMLTFNLKLDDWVLRPVASGYAFIAPDPVRKSVKRFFNNVDVIPRFANNLFQLRLAEAGGEVARFGINSTLGVAGFFDPADAWFGLKEHPDDFGLTLRYYGVPTGPYVMWPFFGPSTIGDTVGLIVDGAMNPLDYVVPWYVYLPVDAGWRVGEAVNYRSLHLNQFEEADRYAVDLYGAVQDAYLQTRVHDTKGLKD
ncbi:MAG TPA: VacJ family lipoprotein [Candidatus Binataceae bacterium]|nr:VacJ family lipoprotein [Candidatus Binataceae bacterium]